MVLQVLPDLPAEPRAPMAPVVQEALVEEVAEVQVAVIHLF
jgi:hypothetical protein